MPGYGVSAGLSKTTQNTVQTAKKEDENGKITATKSFGGLEVITTEEYAGVSFTNEATNGQDGTTSTGVVIEHTLNEVNKDFAKVTKVVEKPLA